MKLLKDSLYLTKDQWRKVFLAMSIMTIVLYIVAMIFSLCGSKYFILNYQNEQMDRIEKWLSDHYILNMVSWAFSTFEFYIIVTFILKRRPKWYYVLTFYVPVVAITLFVTIPPVIYTFLPFVFYLAIPLIELVLTKDFTWKKYGIYVLKMLFATVVSLSLQVMTFVIKSGKFSLENHIMNLSAHFIYAIEYDIALSVILFTVSLFIDREKGDSIWATFLHTLGGFSQTSKKQSQKSSSVKTLTKTQKNKLRLLWFKFYLIQLGGFLLLMVLPFLLGKVFEFLVMYLAFAITRCILGFNYSLHYKKEALCITVGVVVFGILSLAVPFFYIVVIMAILLGVSLAILLHLSYKYKGFFLFNQVAKPDKFAELYVLMDGDLDPHHVEIICRHRGLDKQETQVIKLLAEGNKQSYIAKQLGYEVKTIERRINDALEKLNNI